MDVEKAYLQGRFDSIPIIDDSKEKLIEFIKGLIRINLYIWTCYFALFLRCKNIKKRCCSQLLRLAKEQNYYAHSVNFIS